MKIKIGDEYVDIRTLSDLNGILAKYTVSEKLEILNFLQKNPKILEDNFDIYDTALQYLFNLYPDNHKAIFTLFIKNKAIYRKIKFRLGEKSKWLDEICKTIPGAPKILDELRSNNKRKWGIRKILLGVLMIVGGITCIVLTFLGILPVIGVPLVVAYVGFGVLTGIGGGMTCYGAVAASRNSASNNLAYESPKTSAANNAEAKHSTPAQRKTSRAASGASLMATNRHPFGKQDSKNEVSTATFPYPSFCRTTSRTPTSSSPLSTHKRGSIIDDEKADDQVDAQDNSTRPKM